MNENDLPEAESSLTLVSSRPSDVETAEQFKQRIRSALVPVLAIMTEARRRGLLVQWQLGTDPYGADVIADLYLIKRF